MATIGQGYFRKAVCTAAQGKVRWAARCERWCCDDAPIIVERAEGHELPIDCRHVLIVEQPILINVEEWTVGWRATANIQRKKKARAPKITGLVIGDERAKNNPTTSQDRVAYLSFPGSWEIQKKSPLGLPVNGSITGDTCQTWLPVGIGHGRGCDDGLLQ